MSAAEKTERIMGALMDHLRAKYQLLSSSNVFRLQTNAAGTLTLILDLLSPKVDGGDSDATKFGGDINDIQFLRDVNCGLQYLPTFQIVFTPMAIVSDQDSPPPSSRTLFNVLLVNYQVRKLVFYLLGWIFEYYDWAVDYVTSIFQLINFAGFRIKERLHDFLCQLPSRSNCCNTRSSRRRRRRNNSRTRCRFSREGNYCCVYQGCYLKRSLRRVSYELYECMNQF